MPTEALSALLVPGRCKLPTVTRLFIPSHFLSVNQRRAARKATLDARFTVESRLRLKTGAKQSNIQ